MSPNPAKLSRDSTNSPVLGVRPANGKSGIQGRVKRHYNIAKAQVFPPSPESRAMFILVPSASNQNPLHLVETHFIAPAVVELGGAGAGVVGHGRGLLECAAVFEIRRDAGGTEAVVVD